jgi:hypothetical protein
MRTHSDAELAACARRELAHRKRVYRRLVGEHKMSQAECDKEISMMREIAEIFEERHQPKLI